MPLLAFPAAPCPLLPAHILCVDLATTSYAPEPIFTMYAEYFNTSSFLDQPVSQAFAGGVAF
jgi:hypothetical protein